MLHAQCLAHCGARAVRTEQQCCASTCIFQRNCIKICIYLMRLVFESIMSGSWYGAVVNLALLKSAVMLWYSDKRTSSMLFFLLPCWFRSTQCVYCHSSLLRAKLQDLMSAMPIRAAPVLKQVCSTSIHSCKGMCHFSRRTGTLFCARSQAMSTAKYVLVKDTSPEPCSSPADAWLKAAPRGAMEAKLRRVSWRQLTACLAACRSIHDSQDF